MLEENWDALRLFLASATQWRTAGMAGVVTGLDYTAVHLVAHALKLRFAAVFEDLHVMECAAVEALLERRR